MISYIIEITYSLISPRYDFFLKVSMSDFYILAEMNVMSGCGTM